MTKQELLSDIFKVISIHICAIGITFSDVNEFLKFMSLMLAIGYGAWKWRVDYVKNKRSKHDPYK